MKHTFHGLSAETEYTVSVTAATDLGEKLQSLLPQHNTQKHRSHAAITAATVAMPQSLEAAVSVPSMYSMYSPCLCNAVQLCYTVLYCMYGSDINYHICVPLTPPYYSCRLCVWSTDSSCTCIGTLPLCRVRANQYDYPPKPIALEDRYSAGPSSSAHTRDTQVQYMNTQDLHKM